MILVVGPNSAWQKIALLDRICVGEVNRITEITGVASGKGANVLRALKALGEQGLLIGYAGGLNGRRFRRCLEAEALPARLERIAAETRVCTTLIDPDGAATELIEPSPPVTRGEREGFAALVSAALPAASLLVIAGSSPAGEAEDCYARTIREARQRKLPVLLDAAGKLGRAGLEAGPEILKVNLEELEGLSRRSLGTPAARLAAYRELHRRHGLRWIVVSRGPGGLEGYDGSSAWQAAPPAVRVLNPIGSGDATAAGIARSWLSGAGLREALLQAAALGTAACLSLLPGQIDLERFRLLRGDIRVSAL
jgi:1-phosphofructokinase family hexose kinase